MSSRRQRERRRNRQRASTALVALRVAVVFTILSLLLLAGGVATAGAVVERWMQGLPDVDAPEAFQVAQTTRVYSADGKLLASLYLENREVVPLSRMATDLVNAVVAVEDERFFKHKGVDYESVARAAAHDLWSGGSQQGASTLTMQYVNNTVLSQERYKDTFERKFRQAYLAREVEKRYTKQEILHLYLNTVYFGEGAHGSEAAARTFFGKSAIALTLPEAAMLAGLPQSPVRLSPYDNMAAAKARQLKVLQRMVANGYIGSDEASAAFATKLTLKRVVPNSNALAAPYFVEHVKKILQQQYTTKVVFKGGLRVYTTLDTKLQKLAENSVKGVLDRRGDPDAALVAIDPRTGYVRAMYGGRDFKKNKYNLATQGRRQPGSSFKTFVLATAIEKKIPPYRGIDSGSPAVIPAKPVPWVVSNSEGSGRGFITIESATAHSVNTVFARLIAELKASEVVRVAKRMGITSFLPAYPSIALGSQNVTPLEMASAYGTLATGGVHYKPITITRIIGPDGKVIFQYKPKGKRALSKEVSYAITQLLEGVISGGTGRAANIGRPAAGKTGTSQEYRDAWFVGYTPQLVCAVWNGYQGTERPMRSVHGRKNFGGTFPARIWHDFMRGALKNQRVIQFAKADDPKYIWKDTWSRPSSQTVEPTTTTKPKTRPGGGGNRPPPPPPPPPDTTGTPNP